MYIRRRTLIKAAAGLTLSPALAKAEDSEILGAGSSFIDPVMQRWATMAGTMLRLKVAYQPVGSGNGRNKVLAGDVDFAASDEPLSDDKLAVGNMIQFPLAFGGVTCAVNLPGIADNQLVLSGQLLADIYAGQIKQWSDSRIASVNPGIAMPDLDIHPLSEGSPHGPIPGTTYNFTQYLLASNADWREKYGPAITKRWAVGSMVATNEAMVINLKSLPGSIGYMSIGVARNNKLTNVMLKNKAGRSVVASAASVKAAVSQVDWTQNPNLVVKLIDQPGDETWPIVIATYALLPRKGLRGERVREFFNLALNQGGDAATEHNLAPPPPTVRSIALSRLGNPEG